VKESTTWYSPRVGREVTTVRWGHFGKPVLIFPTAGGDAEEIERFHVIRVLQELIDAGRIKVYSCDSVAGSVLLKGEGNLRHQCAMWGRFQDFIRHELVPAIRMDCGDPEMGIIAAGSSIGAFNAVAVTCRYPDAFTHAIGMSGTYDLTRFFDGQPTADFHYASPVHFLPDAPDSVVAPLRERFILLASGEGKAEDIGESWRLAQILGQRGVPNRVDSWGPDWTHDWPTWRNMLPKYLGEMT